MSDPRMSMLAIDVASNQSLRWVEQPKPTPQADQVLIRIRATALNRADLMQRAGLYPPPSGASLIPGLECAGEIVAVGEKVQDWQVGDAVCALLTAGGWAEYVACPAAHLLPIPTGLSFVEAAALPEVFATAYLNIFIEAAAKAGEKVLIHAGASGVGTAAIQLCQHFNLPCMVTVGAVEKAEFCRNLGATEVVNYRQHSFLQAVNAWGGVDVILDPVGGNYLADNLAALKIDGRLILIGLMGGRMAQLDLGRLLIKRLKVVGSTLRSRTDEFKANLIQQLRQNVWPSFAPNGTEVATAKTALKPVIDRIYPIAEIESACDYMASNQSTGKLILQIAADA